MGITNHIECFLESMTIQSSGNAEQLETDDMINVELQGQVIKSACNIGIKGITQSERQGRLMDLPADSSLITSTFAPFFRQSTLTASF